jgi:hypothetical protein
MNTKLAHVLLASASLLLPLSSQAEEIRVDYNGTVTDIGILLTGFGVSVGSSMSGYFVYDATTGVVSAFSNTFSNGFTADLSSPVNMLVQDDQQNGSATLPGDGFTVAGASTSNILWNGFMDPYMQFGLRQDNADGQLWSGTTPPDLNAWSAINLAAINGPDWRWLDFNVPGTASFADDQIRFSVEEYSANEVNAVPVPTAVWLFLSGLMGVLGLHKRKTLA